MQIKQNNILDSWISYSLLALRMNFLEYLDSKKIDSETFQVHEPKLFSDWQKQFDLMHPKSFTSQKLYYINSVRRKYPKAK